MIITYRPHWAFKLWCFGVADLYCSADQDLPISKTRRIFWAVRGWLLQTTFQFWKIEVVVK